MMLLTKIKLASNVKLLLCVNWNIIRKKKKRKKTGILLEKKKKKKKKMVYFFNTKCHVFFLLYFGGIEVGRRKIL